MSTSVGEAIYKAQEATQTRLPSSGTVLLSVNDKDKIELIEVARGFYECGFTLMGTGRTCDVMVAAGLPAEKVCKINEGRPNILDKITNGEVQSSSIPRTIRRAEAMTATSVRQL